MFSTTKKWKIGVIDDEPDVLKVTQRILERKGFEVLAFADPASALTILKNEPVDLLITDLKMPEMDGLQFLYCIKQIQPNVPVIFVTGYATIQSAVQSIQWGAFDYLRKPYDIEKLYKVVHRALTR